MKIEINRPKLPKIRLPRDKRSRISVSIYVIFVSITAIMLLTMHPLVALIFFIELVPVVVILLWLNKRTGMPWYPWRRVYMVELITLVDERQRETNVYTVRSWRMADMPQEFPRDRFVPLRGWYPPEGDWRFGKRVRRQLEAIVSRKPSMIAFRRDGVIMGYADWISDSDQLAFTPQLMRNHRRHTIPSDVYKSMKSANRGSMGKWVWVAALIGAVGVVLVLRLQGMI